MAKKGPKRVVPASRYRDILATNLDRLMDATPDLSSSPKLQNKSKVKIATINRIRRREVAANLDTLTALADAFDFQPWQLLVHGMDATNPPVIAGASAHERDLYKRLADTASEIAAIGAKKHR